MKKNSTLYLTRGAIIATIYVTLTLFSAVFGLDKGVIQLRLSESLCILPVFFSEAVPGLFIGCLIANLVTGATALDVIFGSIATLLGAIGARLLRNLPEKLIFITTLPTVMANVIIVPLLLKYAYALDGALWFFALTVGIGEIATATIIGTILYGVLKRSGKF